MPSEYTPPVNDTITQHDGTENLAINNTLFHHLRTLIALRTSAKCYPYNSCYRPLSQRRLVKSGYWTHLSEATTMKFIAEHTSIPVPKVYCSFVSKQRAYIVMERIKGDTLAAVWFKLSMESQEHLMLDLKRYIKKLRTLSPPPGAGLQSCTGGSLHDSRMPRSCPRFGPFGSTRAFHAWLKGNITLSDIPDRTDDPHFKDLKRMIALQDREYPAPVFTHCDLSPTNIIVRDDKVVGIIDWEFSGWYPPYWEYTAAWYGNQVRKGWQDLLPRFLDSFPEELEMERVRHKSWGEC